MAYRLLLPKFGMAMETARIIEWMKDVGDYIEKEEAVLVVENEKLTSEIISMQSGTLLRKVALVGELYNVGDLLALLGREGESVEDIQDVASAVMDTGAVLTPTPFASATAGGEPKRGRVVASPLAKKLAAQLGVDIAEVTGRGPGGRVEKADVQSYADALSRQPPSSDNNEMPSQAAAQTTAPLALPLKAVLPEARPGVGYAEVPYAGMRKAVGMNMLNAWTDVPMVTHHVKADVGKVLEIRKTINDGLKDDADKVTINDFLLKLTAAAIKQAPIVNSSLVGDVIRRFHAVNLGMATALEDGLIVPVIRDADRKSLLQISSEAKELSAKARNGSLSADDIAGGTFTVTNLGGFGSVDEFTPIVNPPQAAILGIGRIVETPVAENGEVLIRPLITLSFTYDHRVIDGAVAAQFIKLLMGLIENPLQALMR